MASRTPLLLLRWTVLAVAVGVVLALRAGAVVAAVVAAVLGLAVLVADVVATERRA